MVPRTVGLIALCAALAVPLVRGGDLSGYRSFPFGMNLADVEKQAGIQPSEVRTIHRRPAVIQDVEWRPRHFPGPAPESDPVKDVQFSFYNDKLFRMVVNYDRYRTDGLTTDDMIEAISATYGPGARPSAEVLFPSAFSENVKVISRWEDAKYSFNLVRSPFQPSFALVAFSKELDAQAEAAIIESERLEAQDAPAREAEILRKQSEVSRLQQEKARLANKPGFRP